MTKENFSVQLKSLTPIWTGNALGRCDEIKESGILGSIRWWYEIVSRSLGKRVCNPTQQSKDGKCELKHEEFIESILHGKKIDDALNEQRICSVCKLFGCNGWSSKFKLIVKDGDCKNIISNVYVKGRKFNKVKRYVQGKMFDENNPLTLEFHPLKEISDEEWRLLEFVIKLISKWGALGGKTAQGNGVVEIINQDGFKISKYNRLTSSNDKLPALGDFFFTKCRLEFNENISSIDEKDFWIEKHDNENNKSCNKNTEHKGLKYLWDNYKFLPIGFHIRDIIRRIEENESERHNLFGVVTKKGNKRIQIGSKIFVSHGYKINDNTVECRIWGYGVEKDKREFVEKLQNSIKDNLQGYLFKEKNKYSINFTIHNSEYIDNSLEV